MLLRAIFRGRGRRPWSGRPHQGHHEQARKGQRAGGVHGPAAAGQGGLRLTLCSVGQGHAGRAGRARRSRPLASRTLLVQRSPSCRQPVKMTPKSTLTPRVPPSAGTSAEAPEPRQRRPVMKPAAAPHKKPDMSTEASGPPPLLPAADWSRLLESLHPTADGFSGRGFIRRRPLGATGNEEHFIAAVDDNEAEVVIVLDWGLVMRREN